MDGFDISLDLCPPAANLPSNVKVSQWNVLDDILDGTEGQYDLVHVRLLLAGLPRSANIAKLMQNLMKMLSKSRCQYECLPVLIRVNRAGRLVAMGRGNGQVFWLR